MNRIILLTAVLAPLTAGVQAGWLQAGENDRLVTYVDTTIRTNQNTVLVWVLFDYKTVQESPRSGKRYLSEKAQYEIDRASEKARVLFFTWHSAGMGNGTVVYTGNKPTAWEPTSAPESIASVLWNYVGGSSENPSARPHPSPPAVGGGQRVEQVAPDIARRHNTANLADDMTVSSTAETRGKQINGNLIAQKIVTAIALYLVLFLGIWVWGIFGRKHSGGTGNIESTPRSRTPEVTISTPSPANQTTTAENAFASRKPNKWNYVGIGTGAFMLLFLFIPEVVKGTLANQYYLGGAFWVGVIIFCSINIARAKTRTSSRTAEVPPTEDAAVNLDVVEQPNPEQPENTFRNQIEDEWSHVREKCPHCGALVPFMSKICPRCQKEKV